MPDAVIKEEPIDADFIKMEVFDDMPEIKKEEPVVDVSVFSAS